MSKARQLAELGNAFDDGALSNRSLIINGAMTIDQRNSGSSVTPTSSGYSTVDRWRCTINVASKLSFQQSTVVPNNHKNSLAITSTSAYTLGASEYFTLQQNIEGSSIARLGWGTSAAVDATLSFWVRSSLTGTFGGCAQNATGDRNYPFTYTVNTANTWEKKSVTIPKDTSGTWLTTNGVGISLGFALGVGSTFSGPAGAWSSTYYLSATGAVSLVGTSGATFYITGVQLEVGDTATPFEHRSYGQELALCQRYYQEINTSSRTQPLAYGYRQTTNTVRLSIPTASTLRADPSITVSGTTVAHESDGSTTSLTGISGLYQSAGYVVATGTVSGVVAGALTAFTYGGAIKIEAEL